MAILGFIKGENIMEDKTTIVGAGITRHNGVRWYALEAAKHEGRDLIVRILDQYTENNSTSINIVPSRTLLEMLARLFHPLIKLSIF